jgi:hypothetical protein
LFRRSTAGWPGVTSKLSTTERLPLATEMETQPTMGGTDVMRATALPTGPLAPPSSTSPLQPAIAITPRAKRERMPSAQAHAVPADSVMVAWRVSPQELPPATALVTTVS